MRPFHILTVLALVSGACASVSNRPETAGIAGAQSVFALHVTDPFTPVHTPGTGLSSESTLARYATATYVAPHVAVTISPVFPHENETGTGTTVQAYDDDGAKLQKGSSFETVQYDLAPYNIGVVVLKSDTAEAPIALRDTPVAVGEELQLIGFDFRETVGTQGVLSGTSRTMKVRVTKAARKLDTSIETFEVDAPWQRGLHGSALVDKDGKLAGIVFYSLKFKAKNGERSETVALSAADIRTALGYSRLSQ